MELDPEPAIPMIHRLNMVRIRRFHLAGDPGFPQSTHDHVTNAIGHIKLVVLVCLKLQTIAISK